jgi:hypothetical protein
MHERHNDRPPCGSDPRRRRLDRRLRAVLITLVVGIVGLLVGMAIDGRLDVTSLLGRGRDR